jgi:hypothetical protein
MFLKQVSPLRREKPWPRATQAAKHVQHILLHRKQMVASLLENASHTLGLPKQHQEHKDESPY